MNKYLLGGAVAAAMVAIAPALAQAPAPAPAGPQVQDRLGEPGWHGRDRTSVDTRAEVAGHIRTMFDRLDSNRDGSITKAESEAAKGERHKRFEQRIERRAERGGDKGQVADRRGMFDRIDTNRDGTISRSEFEAAPSRHERRIAMGGGGPGVHKMRGMRGLGMGGLHGHMFDQSDANRDGRVTLQEATNAALRHFDTADVNRDGRLTPEERMQMHQKMRAERKPG